MKVSSKFNIQDKVWFMWNNKATQKRIAQIQFGIVKMKNPSFNIKSPLVGEVEYLFFKDSISNGDYLLKDNSLDFQRVVKVKEIEVFSTKEELLKSL